jgi:hypothetical protein
MNPPSKFVFLLSWLSYYNYRLRRIWKLATFRCPSCPKRIRGPHKLGCSRRPGRGLSISMRMVSKDDRT